MKDTPQHLTRKAPEASSDRSLRQQILLILIVLSPLLSWAMDPPHPTNNCASCHMTHNSLGSSLTSVAGNANLCESCHISGGSASFHPFAESDQALAFPGLFSNVTQQGTSHRWDSGVAGHVAFLRGAPVSSTGTLTSSGIYTGAYPKAYAVVMVTSGNVGVARFNWSTSLGIGSGTNVLTGATVPLNEGITVTFANGAGTSFQVGDQWNIYVRTDIRSPTNSALVTEANGQVTCSTCHDVHSQAYPAFDNTNSTVAVAPARSE